MGFKNLYFRFLPFLLLISFQLKSQIPEYLDYLGAGHSEGIGMRSSSDFSKENRAKGALPSASIDGGGLDGPRMDAARFLSQAAFGGTPAQVENLSRSLDFEAWIEWQVNLAPTSMSHETKRLFTAGRSFLVNNGGNVSNYNNNRNHFQYAWWNSVMTKPDVLRQRVAQALSEIIVISTDSDIENNGLVYANYYDILMRNAFGNYRSILEEVSLHPAMGVYLSHFRNPKTDTVANSFPDENYAREIMQLFTIGLYKLNNDGSLQLDSEGNPIPTYTIENIRQLAKVFTGLGAGGLNQRGINENRNLNFRTGTNFLDYTKPMAMYENEHEQGEKFLLDGVIIPEGKTGMEDILITIDHLFNHPNVGPFIGRKLIQQLVKSNPSPEYINDVANVFNNNGEGVRGDMKAVIKTILLHEEARTCLWQTMPDNGKLRSPVARYAHFAKASSLSAPDGLFLTNANGFLNNTSHKPLSSPSVFNFYLPDHIPNGPLAEQHLFGPEFEIHNSVTSIGYVNEVDNWARRGIVFSAFELEEDIVLRKDAYFEMAKDPDVLLNHMDVFFTHGRLSEETRDIIKEAMLGLPENNQEANLRQRVELAFYLVMISADYTILK